MKTKPICFTFTLSSIPHWFIDINVFPEMANSLDYITVSEVEFHWALVSLDPSKALGLDNVRPRILVSCTLALYKPLHHLLKTSLKYVVVPEQWHLHKVTPIFKSGDPCSLRNYRPILPLSNTSKVLEHLIYDKMINYVSGFISSAQYG